MKHHSLCLLLVATLLAACGSSAEPIEATQVPEQEQEEAALVDEVAPTDAPEPTNPPTDEPTQEPTEEATPTTEPTATPEGILFYDDFDGTLGDGWTWENEVPEQWTFTEDGFLEVTADDYHFIPLGSGGGEKLNNFLTRSLPEGDFMITTHVIADPQENFQQATIFIYQDKSNYISLNVGFCSFCLTPGHGYYMETFIDNNPFGDAFAIPRQSDDTDVYLRLINQSGSLTGYYATEPDNWQRAGAFGNYFEFVSVGIGATNSYLDGTQNDLVARFDFFEIALP